MIRKRQENAIYLAENLPDILIPVKDFNNHAFMFFPMLVEQRDALMWHLDKQGIDTRTMMPLTTQPVAKPYIKKKYPATDYINKHGLLIGCHQYLTRGELNWIIVSIKEFYAGFD